MPVQSTASHMAWALPGVIVCEEIGVNPEHQVLANSLPSK